MEAKSLSNVLYIGSGYVGSLSAITMAIQNPKVKFTVYDINKKLIAKWNSKDGVTLPFFEPQLEEYFMRAKSQGNISFTCKNFDAALKEAEAVFICVNTPPAESQDKFMGQPSDLSAFKSVMKAIGESAANDAANQYRILINKSTVPVGTTTLAREILKKYDVDQYFTVASMPEFLAEGQAINNLMNPDRTVIGTPNSPLGDHAFVLLKQLYDHGSATTINTRCASAELGKLMANAMLAQRISSINSISSLTENIEGCDISDVKAIVSSDSRIGSKYLQPGPGFGGSCFDKDLMSLIHILDSNDEHDAALYWQGVLNMNNYQKKRLAKLVAQDLTKQVRGSASISSALTVSIFGFAYKKNTSDTRMSQAAAIIDYLANVEGMNVQIHDPQVEQGSFEVEMEAQGFLVQDENQQTPRIRFMGPDYLKAAANSSCIVIMTECDEFKKYDFTKIRAQMNEESASIYDFRAYLDLNQIKKCGFGKVFRLGAGYL